MTLIDLEPGGFAKQVEEGEQACKDLVKRIKQDHSVPTVKAQTGLGKRPDAWKSDLRDGDVVVGMNDD